MFNKQKQQAGFTRTGAHLFTIIAAATILATGCDRNTATQPAAKTKADAGPVTVYTTFYPTAYFTTRIADDLAKVVNPAPPDADPAFWTPDGQTIAAYQKADLIVINGASFEKWVAKVSLPQSRVVDTAKPFKNEFIVFKKAVTHTHGPGGKHSHKGTDGHTWLDPINAKTQAGEILKALVKLRPEHKQAFEKGYAALCADLDKLDARLKEVSKLIGDQTLFCSHPAYNYVGRRYGWTEVNFHAEPSVMLDEKTLANIREQATKQSVHYMLWEAQPIPELAAAMTEMGLTNVVYSPCETLDPKDAKAGADLLTVMNANVDRLAASLKSSGENTP